MHKLNGINGIIYAQVLTQEHLMENTGNFSKTLAMSNHKQNTQCNTILNEDGNLAVNYEQTADLLRLHYQKISRLNFSVEDRNIKIRASRIVHAAAVIPIEEPPSSVKISECMNSRLRSVTLV
ncbi:hypothetical protein TNCV_279131 [Trichonephila clavipes]|nr:hypothetical protein TNCV_279131 [Trichonephila clavipes]